MAKHWEVHGSLPEQPGSLSKWRSNITCHVIAASARRALELIEQKHPGVEVWAIQHRGKIDVIEDVEPNVELSR